MSKIILITGNCVTAGLTTALQFLCPSVRMVPLSIADLDNAEKVQQALGVAACWVTAFRADLADTPAVKAINPDLKVLRIPALSFTAFHPDIAYVRNQLTSELVVPHYNSRIGVWAYNKGLNVPQALQLFNKEVFRQVGYLNRWESDVAQLKHQFDLTDLKNEFTTFYLRLRRLGCFMHSVNHPRVEMIVELARAVARALNLETVEPGAEILFSDVLDNENWPVYPPIAESLGLSNGSYLFKLGERSVAIGLEAYLNYSFQNYHRMGLEPGQLKFEHPEPKGFSETLENALAAA